MSTRLLDIAALETESAEHTFDLRGVGYAN